MKKIFALCLLFSSSLACASTITTSINLINASGTGASVGSVNFTDTQYGLLITPKLTGLPPGAHGFHIHVNPSCADLGQAAGGHLDPKNTNQHLGPYNNSGHLGDLPVLNIDAQGNDNTPILAPRLSVAQITHHSVMIHAGGDNYSDQPPMGGGGARLACGVIK